MRLATRGSPLARWQTDHVAALLRAARPGLVVEPVVVSTLGDRRLDQDIWQLGGAGVFVKEVQAAVLEDRADAAVHSARTCRRTPPWPPPASSWPPSRSGATPVTPSSDGPWPTCPPAPGWRRARRGDGPSWPISART